MARKREEANFETLIEWLESSDWEQRFRATEGLGKIKDPRGIKPLIKALSDTDEYVREGAAWALGEIRAKEVLKPLLQAFDDKDKYVREGAVAAVGKLKDPDAVEPLVRVLREGDESMRRAAETALAGLGPLATEAATALLDDQDWDVRWRAVRILAETKDKRAVDPLIRAMKDENKYVREAAVLALAVSDGDPLAAITVSVAAPPRAGRIEPVSCSAASAVAGGLRYVHTASDQSDDRIVLAVSDGVNPPVLVAAEVAVRLRPDRLSIVSDPLLEAVRGATTAHAITTLPAGAVLALRPYGAPLPPPPAGVTLASGRLLLDWSRIPPDAAWIALAIEATTGDAAVPAGRRTAVQRMVVRVRAAAAAGTAN